MDFTKIKIFSTKHSDYWYTASVILLVLSAGLGGGMVLYAVSGTFIGFGGLFAALLFVNGIYGMLWGGLPGAVLALVSFIKKGHNRKSLIVLLLNLTLAVVPVSYFEYTLDKKEKQRQVAIEAQSPTQRLFGLVSVTRLNKQEFIKLLELGGDINAIDSRGFTLLGAGIITVDDPTIIDLFVSNGADVNKQGGEGWAPIHFAASGGEVEKVEKLLEYGADPALQTDKGETALVIAENRLKYFNDRQSEYKQFKSVISLLRTKK